MKKELIFNLVGHYKDKFPFFFDDFECRYQSSEDFQFNILSNLEYLILPPHDIDGASLYVDQNSSSSVLSASDSVEYLYFVHIGQVNVFDLLGRFILQYQAGSIFGDFQMILGTKSGYKYLGNPHRTNYLFQVKKDIFLQSLFNDYDAMVYLTKIALQKRKHIKKIAKQIALDNQSKPNIPSQDRNTVTDFYTKSKQEKVGTSSTKLRVQQLIEIKCLQNKKTAQYVKNLLEDLKRSKKTKDEDDEESGDESSSLSESEFNEDRGCDIHPLYSDDEMSSGEEDEELLPENYKFFSARI